MNGNIYITMDASGSDEEDSDESDESEEDGDDNMVDALEHQQPANEELN